MILPSFIANSINSSAFDLTSIDETTVCLKSSHNDRFSQQQYKLLRRHDGKGFTVSYELLIMNDEW